MRGDVLGAIICVLFAGVWGAAGAAGLPRRRRRAAMVLSAALSAAILVALILWPPSDPQQGTFRSRIYEITIAAEAIPILAAIVILRRISRRDLLLPVIGLIVGLHFIGMWMTTDLPVFLAVAAAMCAFSALSLLLARGNDSGWSPRRSVAGFGCAAVLWAAGLATWLHN